MVRSFCKALAATIEHTTWMEGKEKVCCNSVFSISSHGRASSSSSSSSSVSQLDAASSGSCWESASWALFASLFRDVSSPSLWIFERELGWWRPSVTSGGEAEEGTTEGRKGGTRMGVVAGSSSFVLVGGGGGAESSVSSDSR